MAVMSVHKYSMNMWKDLACFQGTESLLHPSLPWTNSDLQSRCPILLQGATPSPQGTPSLGSMMLISVSGTHIPNPTVAAAEVTLMPKSSSCRKTSKSSPLLPHPKPKSWPYASPAPLPHQAVVSLLLISWISLFPHEGRVSPWLGSDPQHRSQHTAGTWCNGPLG